MLKMINETLDEITNIPLESFDNETLHINKLLDMMPIHKPMTSKEIMDKLNIKSKETLRNNYLNPAIKSNYIKLTIPEKTTSKNQMYYKIKE